jgi:hypothetical protein
LLTVAGVVGLGILAAGLLSYRLAVAPGGGGPAATSSKIKIYLSESETAVKPDPPAKIELLKPSAGVECRPREPIDCTARITVREEEDLPQAVIFEVRKGKTVANSVTAQPGPIEQPGGQPVQAIELIEEGANLVPSQDNRQPLGPLGVHEVVADPFQGPIEHDLVEKKQRAEGLVLRGGGHAPGGGEVVQKGDDLGLAHLGGCRFPWKRMNCRTQAT